MIKLRTIHDHRSSLDKDEIRAQIERFDRDQANPALARRGSGLGVLERSAEKPEPLDREKPAPKDDDHERQDQRPPETILVLPCEGGHGAPEREVRPDDSASYPSA